TESEPALYFGDLERLSRHFVQNGDLGSLLRHRLAEEVPGLPVRVENWWMDLAPFSIVHLDSEDGNARNWSHFDGLGTTCEAPVGVGGEFILEVFVGVGF